MCLIDFSLVCLFDLLIDCLIVWLAFVGFGFDVSDMAWFGLAWPRSFVGLVRFVTLYFVCPYLSKKDRER